jgi:hypothetical protein
MYFFFFFVFPCILYFLLTALLAIKIAMLESAAPDVRGGGGWGVVCT